MTPNTIIQTVTPKIMPYEIAPTTSFTDEEHALNYLEELLEEGEDRDEMEVPEQKGWDIQTYDNLVDEVMK